MLRSQTRFVIVDTLIVDIAPAELCKEHFRPLSEVAEANAASETEDDIEEKTSEA